MFKCVCNASYLFIVYYMDDMSTPIDQLQPNENPQDYQDVLTKMQDAPPPHYNQPSVHQISPPSIQTMKHPVQNPYNVQQYSQYRMPNHDAQYVSSSRNTTFNMDGAQRDFVYVTIVCMLLYSDVFQQTALRNIPALFRDSKPTVVGTVVNGALAGILYVVFKNVSIGVKG